MALPIRISDLDTEEIIALHEQKGFTLQQIADHYHVTRQAIHYHVNVKRRILKGNCSTCGKEFEYRRKPGKPRKFIYCGNPCTRPKLQKQVWEELAKSILEP